MATYQLLKVVSEQYEEDEDIFATYDVDVTDKFDKTPQTDPIFKRIDGSFSIDVSQLVPHNGQLDEHCIRYIVTYKYGTDVVTGTVTYQENQDEVEFEPDFYSPSDFY